MGVDEEDEEAIGESRSLLTYFIIDEDDLSEAYSFSSFEASRGIESEDETEGIDEPGKKLIGSAFINVIVMNHRNAIIITILLHFFFVIPYINPSSDDQTNF